MKFGNDRIFIVASEVIKATHSPYKQIPSLQPAYMPSFKNINRVFIANRGEVACRIIRACKENGLTSIVIYSKEDIESLHVKSADEAFQLQGIGSSAYTDIDQIVSLAQEVKADVVIPGYGFLSENKDFELALNKVKIGFAGPDSRSIEQFGLKHLARKLAVSCDVPVIPGTDIIEDENELVKACTDIGYPVMLKATAGGGGMGIKVCNSDNEVKESFIEIKSRGTSLFKNAGVFVEKYISKGRHIEVQLFGNGLGDIVTFGERECSIQRRHQKVIEETPSPFVSHLGAKYGLRGKLTACARRLAEQVKYKSAGTVEFLVDNDDGSYYFLEMNTRLQVEHGITELVYNTDLVYLMLLQADYELSGSGIPLSILKKNIHYQDGVEVPHGHAIEVRVYAENPVKNFAPSPGILHNVFIPANGEYSDWKIRVDHWITTGGHVSPYFDPLLAKAMVWSPTRTSENIVKLLNMISIQGPINNIEYCISILESQDFNDGITLTTTLDSFKFSPHLIEFVEAGSYSSIQDLPGRNNIRHGVPRSGPVDPLALQLANVAVGNDMETACIEFTAVGGIIKFYSSATVALAGGKFDSKVDEMEIPYFTELRIPKGSILDVGTAQGKCGKCYLAVKGGFPGIADWLGSKSCSPSLKLGGHQGRTIVPGDCLQIAGYSEEYKSFATGYRIPDPLIPEYERGTTVIRVISGPHDTPDIASIEGLTELYSTDYKVGINSNRGAIALDGPSFKFSREHGGDGGGHPSNILEYPYPSCGLSTVGSSMVLFGVDGATLSGFTCICVAIEVDVWKFGQSSIGSKIQFKLIDYSDAIKLLKQRKIYLDILSKRPTTTDYKFADELESYKSAEPMGKFLYTRESGELPYVAFRQAGEGMIILDFNIVKYSLFNNGRQYILDNLVKQKLDVLATEASTGAYAVCFDPLKVDREELLNHLIELEASIPPVENLKVPSRIYHLPMCFNHSAIKHSIDRYMHAQRRHAPYLPSNVDYLMKANCLNTFEDFKKCVTGKTEITVAVSFLCANPLLVLTDPRDRFVTSKYNPPRTDGPAGALSSGSVCQSIDPVNSPGGYMLWAITLPNWYWDTFCRIHEKPWPLEVFDQVIYYEVTEEELDILNVEWMTGRREFKPEQSEFDFVQYSKFLNSIDTEVQDLSKRKQIAFAKLIKEERIDHAKWEEEKAAARLAKASALQNLSTSDNAININATMPANVFRINFEKGESFQFGEPVIILESMKMEIPVRIRDKSGSEDDRYRIAEVLVEEGDVVGPGETLMVVERE